MQPTRGKRHAQIMHATCKDNKNLHHPSPFSLLGFVLPVSLIPPLWAGCQAACCAAGSSRRAGQRRPFLWQHWSFQFSVSCVRFRCDISSALSRQSLDALGPRTWHGSVLCQTGHPEAPLAHGWKRPRRLRGFERSLGILAALKCSSGAMLCSCVCETPAWGSLLKFVFEPPWPLQFQHPSLVHHRLGVRVGGV